MRFPGQNMEDFNLQIIYLETLNDIEAKKGSMLEVKILIVKKIFLFDLQI